MACDICGDNRAPLNDLLPVYQTSDIRQVCPGCEKIVNKQHSRLREMLVSRMLPALTKRFISNLRSHPTR